MIERDDRTGKHRPARAMDRISRWITTLLALGVLALMLAIVAQVIVSRLGITNLITFADRVPLFGYAVKLNSLTDLQWYLMALIALIACAIVWLDDRHVRVDFLYKSLSARGRAIVEFVGHCVFTIPFLVMCIPASWQLTLQAFARSEKSANGGLWDRFLVKGFLTLGLTMLLLVILVELIPTLRQILKRAGK